MDEEFVFRKDVFLKTDYPVAVDSKDRWSPVPGIDHPSLFVGVPDYYGQPVSFISDHHSGEGTCLAIASSLPEQDKIARPWHRRRLRAAHDATSWYEGTWVGRTRRRATRHDRT